MRSGKHVRVRVFLWRPDPIHLCCSLGTLNLDRYFEMRWLLGLKLARLVSLASQPAPPPAITGVHHMPDFLCGCWELNWRPRVSVTSTLLSHLSSPSTVCLSGLSQSLCFQFTASPSFLVTLDQTIASYLVLLF